jgi:hypothetical protein
MCTRELVGVLFKVKVSNYDDSTSSRTFGAKVQRTRHDMEQPVRRSLTRYFAVLGTSLLVLGIMAAAVPASSAASPLDGPAGTALRAAAGPASLQAVIRKSLGSSGYSRQAELTGSSVGFGPQS